MRYVIVGAGAMGCLYGAKLRQIGQEVILIAARASAVDTINTNGVHLKEPASELVLRIPAYLASQYQETADAVLLFTKSIHTKDALASVRQCIGPDTCLVSFQNGIGNENILRPYADEDHMIIGTTNFPSDRQGDGIIASAGTGITAMMTVSGRRTKQLHALFSHLQEAGLHPQLRDDIFVGIWEKAAFNAALNSLTAVTLVPQGYMGETPEGRELAHTIAREVCSVALAKGIPVIEARVLETVDTLLDHHFEHCPSMLQDVLRERMTEIDAINGAAVQEAEVLGMQIPVTKVLWQLVRIVQKTYSQRLVTRK